MLSLNKYLKASITVLLCLLLFKTIDAQNLISNGSFETSTNNDCYGSFDHHTFPNPHILDHWYNFNSPDYFNRLRSELSERSTHQRSNDSFSGIYLNFWHEGTKPMLSGYK